MVKRHHEIRIRQTLAQEMQAELHMVVSHELARNPRPMPTSKIRVGQVFRVPYRGLQLDAMGLHSYQDLTRGRHTKSADSQKGMFFYQQVKERGQNFPRLPAFIFLSNPFKKGAEGTPWVDVVEPDVGYCLFHGDNRRVGAEPLSSRGNEKFIQSQQFYSDPNLRKFAPPVLVFEQTEQNGVRRGYRSFYS